MVVTALAVSQSIADAGTFTGNSVTIEGAPFEDSATFQYSASGATQTIELQGRPAPDADWARLLLISGGVAGANSVKYSPEYRVVVVNATGGGAITFTAYVGR